MIKLRQICKSFDGTQIYDNFSLDFRKGEMVCLVGAAGSGKSTLLRILGGIVSPDSGELVFPSGETPRIGMIFQHFNLFPHLNVLQNLTLAPLKVLNMPYAQAERLALEYLELVGLAHKRHYYPGDLSAGQQQRVAIARCLVMNPQLILLDEPLSSLDPIAVGEVMDVLRKLKKEKTLIMATHKLDVVSELADRVIFMHKGRVHEDGTAEEVIGSPKSELARRFVRSLKNLVYTIESPLFDRPELNARIEQYCNRFGLGTQAFHFTQLAVEESLNLVPLDKGVQLVLSKSENEVRMSLELIVEDSGISFINDATCNDDLSLSLIKGLCDRLDERVDGNHRILHLELNKESLL